MSEEVRAHGATVELNRGMKGEYSIRIVARSDDPMRARVQALNELRMVEEDLGIVSGWHARFDGGGDDAGV